VSPIFRRHGHRARSTLPPASVLRRERRALLRFREERLRDLGGLLLEMFRRDRFREDLVRERCEELLEIDEHLAGLDTLLGVSWTVPEAARRCAACGSPLPADAAFCARCGTRADAPQVGPAEPEDTHAPNSSAELAEG
jgi:hypothetical protein